MWPQQAHNFKTTSIQRQGAFVLFLFVWHLSYFCVSGGLHFITKTNNVYLCKPQFYYKKWGLRGSKLYRVVFVMSWLWHFMFIFLYFYKRVWVVNILRKVFIKHRRTFGVLSFNNSIPFVFPSHFWISNVWPTNDSHDMAYFAISFLVSVFHRLRIREPVHGPNNYILLDLYQDKGWCLLTLLLLNTTCQLIWICTVCH